MLLSTDVPENIRTCVASLVGNTLGGHSTQQAELMRQSATQVAAYMPGGALYVAPPTRALRYQTDMASLPPPPPRCTQNRYQTCSACGQKHAKSAPCP